MWFMINCPNHKTTVTPLMMNKTLSYLNTKFDMVLCVMLSYFLSHVQCLSKLISKIYKVRVMVFNTTFNNISVILWRSIFFGGKKRVPREKQRLSQITDPGNSHIVRQCSTNWAKGDLLLTQLVEDGFINLIQFL
jgi:hypothetical protein